MVYTVREVFFMKLTGKKLSEKLKKFEFHWTKKKIIALVILLIALVLIGLFCWWLAKPMIRMANDPDMFRFCRSSQRLSLAARSRSRPGTPSAPSAGH